MTGVWRVDRPGLVGNDTELFPTEETALNRERALRLSGVNQVCAWYDHESQGPWVEREEVA